MLYLSLILSPLLRIPVGAFGFEGQTLLTLLTFNLCILYFTVINATEVLMHQRDSCVNPSGAFTVSSTSLEENMKLCFSLLQPVKRIVKVRSQERALTSPTASLLLFNVDVLPTTCLCCKLLTDSFRDSFVKCNNVKWLFSFRSSLKRGKK